MVLQPYIVELPILRMAVCDCVVEITFMDGYYTQ